MGTRESPLRTWFRSVLMTGGMKREVVSDLAMLLDRTIWAWWPRATVSEMDTNRTVQLPTPSTTIAASDRTWRTVGGIRPGAGGGPEED